LQAISYKLHVRKIDFIIIYVISIAAEIQNFEFEC
jgi:hypothetical protein